MNDWMCPEFEWDDSYRPDRGKVLSAEEVEQLDAFYRYLDSDGDGIAARTLPGTHPKGAYFTRGSGHNKFGGYTEDSAEYKEVLDRLLVKWETARTLVPAPEIDYDEDNRDAIVSVGGCDGAVREALDVLRAQGLHLNYCRVRAFPFSASVREFLARHERVFVVEQNRDAQLRTLLIVDADGDPRTLEPALFYDGMPLTAKQIIDLIGPKMTAAQPA